MELVFQVAVLILLALIVLELQGLKAELRRSPPSARGNEEKKDSPTINVNVGTLPLQARVEAEEKGEGAVPAASGASAMEEVQTAPAVEESGAEPGAGEDAPEPERPSAPAQPEYRHVDVNATPSGLMVVKCPFCQAENSSFRSECFNCGKSLH